MTPIMQGLIKALLVQHNALQDVYYELQAKRSASITSTYDFLFVG